MSAKKWKMPATIKDRRAGATLATPRLGVILKNLKMMAVALVTLAVACTSCNFEASNGVISKQTFDSLMLAKKLEQVTLAVCVIDDLTGSYTNTMKQSDLSLLVEFMSTLPGRKVLGYTTVTENSNVPVERLTLLSVPIIKENVNMWVEDQASDYILSRAVSNAVDSVNQTGVLAFREAVAIRAERPIAMRSDVSTGLSRAAIFLNEFPQDTEKVLVACTDFKDTFGRSIPVGENIRLLVVGNIRDADVIRCCGRVHYELFESHEEALIQLCSTIKNKKP